MILVVQLTGTSGTVGGGGRMKHLKPNLNLVLSDIQMNAHREDVRMYL